MAASSANFHHLTQGVSGRLATRRTSAPNVLKSFGALPLSVAARCDPCIGFHMQTLVMLRATRQHHGRDPLG